MPDLFPTRPRPLNAEDAPSPLFMSLGDADAHFNRYLPALGMDARAVLTYSLQVGVIAPCAGCGFLSLPGTPCRVYHTRDVYAGAGAGSDERRPAGPASASR